jgi:hypothetical protein
MSTAVLYQKLLKQDSIEFYLPSTPRSMNCVNIQDLSGRSFNFTVSVTSADRVSLQPVIVVSGSKLTIL